MTETGETPQPEVDPRVRARGDDVAVFTHAGEETLLVRETILFACEDDGTWIAVREHLSPATQT